MITERLAWAGSVVMACVGIYVSYVPIANDLGKWLVAGLAGLVILAALLMFPWRRRSDGSPARLANQLRIGGRANRTQVAGENATQLMADRDAIVDYGGRGRDDRRS